MRYKCNCGSISKLAFTSFQQGHRCKKCGIKKVSGKNNYSYNLKLTDEDRIDRRLIQGYKDWIKNTYKMQIIGLLFVLLVI